MHLRHVLAIAVGLSVSLVYAEDVAPTVIPTPNTNIPFVPGQIPNECANGVTVAEGVVDVGTDILSKILGEDDKNMVGSGTFTIASECGSAQADHFSEKPTCENLSRDTVKKILESSRKEQARLACEIGKAEAGIKEISCLDSMAKAAEENLQGLVQSLTPMLNEAKTALNQMDSDIADRNEQLRIAQERLPKLVSAQSTLRELVNGGAQGKGLIRKSQEIRTSIRNYRAQQTKFKAVVEQYKYGLAVSCFMNEQKAGATCTSDGGVSTKSRADYISCLVAESGVKDSKGNLNTTLASKAQKQKAGIKADFEQLKNMSPGYGEQFPTEQFISSDPSKPNTSGFKTYTYNSEADFFSKFLQRYANTNVTIRGKSLLTVVSAEMSECMQKARNQVNSEMGKSGSNARSTLSGLSTVQEQMQNQEDAFRTQLKEDVQGASEVYRQAMEAATGKDYQLNTAPCLKEVNLEAQAGCAQQMANTLNSLLTGNTQAVDNQVNTQTASTLTSGAPSVSAFVQEVKAPANGKLTFQMACKGVNGCVTAYQGAIRDLNADLKRIDQGKNTYKNAVNKATTEKTDQLGKAMKATSQFIHNRKAEIEKRLKISLSMTSEKISAKDLQPDPQTGVMDIQDIAQLAKSKIQPPLLASKESESGGGIKDLRDEIKELSEKRQKVLAVNETVADVFKKCESKSISAKLKELQDERVKLLELLNRCMNKGNRAFDSDKTASTIKQWLKDLGLAAADQDTQDLIDEINDASLNNGQGASTSNDCLAINQDIVKSQKEIENYENQKTKAGSLE